MILRSSHEVTAEFRWSQFVTPVTAPSIAHMGSGSDHTPWFDQSRVTAPIERTIFSMSAHHNLLEQQRKYSLISLPPRS